MSAADDRKKKRREKRSKRDEDDKSKSALSAKTDTDARVTEWLAKNEDELVKFTTKVNTIYKQKLGKDAPFMTFVFCGLQSTGKSTIMERFMMAVLNIVREGTGTRCPLDTTCIHDENSTEPKCDLWGEELDRSGENLSVDEVFRRITNHNLRLAENDEFSTKPLVLTYRASNVQNMRFVDTPGIITTTGTGKDNREDIKNILRSEMSKVNCKLCVLLEPKDLETNQIIAFCDDTFGGRDKWIHDATFLMTKFDKQVGDARSASKTNKFFQTFWENKCFPHLVITPTLAKEDIPHDKLIEERQRLLENADSYEKKAFQNWLDGHENFRNQSDGDSEVLDERASSRIGFGSAKRVMREIMLSDTASRLPEVLRSLRDELNNRRKERKILSEKFKYTDPSELRLVVIDLVFNLQKRIESYLDGDLESSRKFPERLQTLEDEIEDEENSDWADKELNHHTENEHEWRDKIAEMEEYPDHVQAEEKFLGGKQHQRAIDFFGAVMIDSLPDTFQYEAIAPNGTGYLAGGLMRENWERCMVQITKSCMKEITHPGVNYLVKHVGSILRGLFTLALEDVRQGQEKSATFQLMPSAVEKYLKKEFDEMLWNLMRTAADKIHCAMEPMYSTVDPTLPTFDSGVEDKDDEEEGYTQAEGLMMRTKRQLMALFSGQHEAKKFMKEESRIRALEKKSFLSDQRTAMITKEETATILRRSFLYIVALMEFMLKNFKFQINHYLFVGFKEQFNSCFIKNVTNADWKDLVEPDSGLEDKLKKLDDQIAALSESLREVEQMNMRL
jgi:hypothetical protein